MVFFSFRICRACLLHSLHSPLIISLAFTLFNWISNNFNQPEIYLGKFIFVLANQISILDTISLFKSTNWVKPVRSKTVNHTKGNSKTTEHKNISQNENRQKIETSRTQFNNHALKLWFVTSLLFCVFFYFTKSIML